MSFTRCSAEVDPHLMDSEPLSVAIEHVASCEFRCRRSAVEFSQDRDDLRFAKAALLHMSLLGRSGRNSQFKPELNPHLTSVVAWSKNFALRASYVSKGSNQLSDLSMPTENVVAR
jgi:hypothetical protein